MGLLGDNHLIFPSGWSIGAVLIVLAVVGALCWRWNRPTRLALSRRLFYVVAIAQLIGALLLVLWLVNPRVRYTDRSNRGQGVAVLVDDSLSMGKKDAPGGAGRYETANELLFSNRSKLRKEIERRVDVSDFVFDTDLKETGPNEYPERPDRAGVGTHLAEALSGLGGEVRSRRLQAVILASDGVDTRGGDFGQAIRDLRTPVYAIGVGRRLDPNDPWRNVGIVSIDVPTRVNINQEVEVKVNLKQENLTGEPAPIEIAQEDRPIASTDYQLTHSPRQTASLHFTPTEKGTRTYTVSISPPNGDTYEPDNRMDFTIVVTRETISVLYVEGTLRWNYKFLRRVLQSERTVDADCIVRTGGGKLYQQGESEIRLEKALPADYATLQNYDVLILGDLPRQMMDDKQMDMIDRFVREDKGGLLVLGGPELFTSGEFAGSPLTRLLPAELPEGQTSIPPAQEQHPNLTPIGQTSPVLRGLVDFLPAITIDRVYPVAKTKSSAEVWAESNAGGSKRPVVLGMRYGQGRGMLLTTEDLWRPVLREDGARDESPTARFWLQAIQWLAQREDEGDVSDPLLMAYTDKSYYEPSEKITVRSILRPPEEGGAMGSVSGEIRMDEQTIGSLQFPEPADNGEAQLVWEPPHDGIYRAIVRAERGGETAEVSCAFTVGRPHQETERNGLNEALLRRIAQESGGAYFTPLDAEDIVKKLDQSMVRQTRQVDKPMRGSWPIFLAFCGVLGIGWAVRRGRNLI